MKGGALVQEKREKFYAVDKIIDKLFKGIEILIAIFLGVMIFFTFMNVILRQFSMGFPWSEEVARICFIYLIYLGSIIAARENQHLMIDTLFTKLPEKGKIILYVILQLIIIALMAFLADGAYLNAYKNRNDFWVATGFPMFMVHFAGVILGVSVIIISLANLYRALVLKESVEVLIAPKREDGEDGGEVE
ncbi:TRAP transporter small permease [Criibacterium bergeronii]|uniref:TRAP transporter small permease n=1 Tax=Criibacterium bergeronii TaxID=1871336 RepID=A0A552V3F1_9FIRM|nr:TRAP transporter small permease [Criibacterium bergeronii]